MIWAQQIATILSAALPGVLLYLFLGYIIYGTSYYLLGRRAGREDSELAITLFRVLATLLSLLLSLTFADLREGIGEVRHAIEAETSALGNTLRDLDVYDDAESAKARDLLIDYIEATINEEWQSLRDGRLDSAAMEAFREAKLAIYALTPSTPMEEKLHNRLISDISDVNRLRASRLVYRDTGPPPLFLYIALVGFASTTALLGVYSPTARSLVFMGLYCAFFGIVIHSVIELSRFYDGLGAVTPEPLETLLSVARDQIAS